MQILQKPLLGQYVREIRYYRRPTVASVWKKEVHGQHPRDWTDSDCNLLDLAIDRAGFSGDETKRTNVKLTDGLPDNLKSLSILGHRIVEDWFKF
ncbi:hypothetical protein N7478_008277 [Penicillium angulare]|uniref:uncharacterized protein n=1 Tax=Penicillium angulare TaxID=116970 RepID=UPI00253F6972|nr:uncharacterized protein N7478_008277 [Penicillium angulare]KAJ5273152.1 hypothetical protein N7478_008277 [Penicillium angulare]